MTSESISELWRPFTALDSRLEILVETFKSNLRLLIPTKYWAHEKGQHAREIFRLYQGRGSRLRLTRFETEGVLPNKETIRGTPPSEFAARVLLQKQPSGTQEHSKVCKIYAPTRTVGSKVMPSSTQWSLSPFSIVSFLGTTSMDLINLGVHSGYFEKARN